MEGAEKSVNDYLVSNLSRHIFSISLYAVTITTCQESVCTVTVPEDREDNFIVSTQYILQKPAD